MIYSLYGQPASGKTTIGKMLASYLNTPFFIDGDEFREIFANTNYSKSGREQNIRNANAVATYLNKKGKTEDWAAIYCKDTPNLLHGRPVNTNTDVVMSLVNPYKKLRKELKKQNGNQVVEILLCSNRELRKEYHVKDFEDGSPDYIINTDCKPNRAFKQLIQLWNL
tara:strand:+ start:53 stop:553 length:501 start_codon:yes stop_codon:yes gene_type:complete